MKNFNLFIRNVLPLGKIRKFAGAVIIYVMALLLPGGVFAQKPVISYSGAQTYTTGTAITPLTPTATGVAAFGYSNPVVVGSGFKRVTEVVADPAGNVYACDNRFMLNQFGGGGNVSFINEILASDGSTVALFSDTYSIFGLAEDAAGNLYIKDGRDSVIKIPAGGGVSNATRLGSGFFGSRGVAVDAAGNVYVADHGNDAVKKIPAGNGPVQTIWNSVLPVGIAADAAGNVFVDNDVDGSVYKISAGGGNPFLLIKGEGGLGTDAGGNLFIGGSSIRLIPAGGTTPVTISSGYSNAAGITVDRSENVYMACSINDTIVGVKKITPVGGYFITPQLPAGLTFDSNTGIISGLPAVASPATVYTITGYNTSGVSTATVSITVISVPEPIISYSSPQSYQAGTAITPLTPSSVGAVVSAPAFSSPSALVLSTFSTFSNPASIAADAAGDLLVGDPGNTSVFRLAAGAAATTTVNGGVDKAGGVAFDAAGNMYLVDFEFNVVEKFPPSGPGGTLGSGFSHPAGVAVDGAGNVYVTDQGHSAVKEILAGTGAIVSLGSGFSQPNGIAVDGSGNVYVTDNANSLVKKIIPGNSTPVTIGSGFSSPKGVAVDAAGNVYVADAGNNAVKEILATDGSTINIGSGFSAPAGVAVDGLGNLYVADSGNGVVKELNAVGGYYINPFLPAGLSFNNATGVISGTPTTVSPSTNYTVTAYTGASSGSAILTIAVAAPPVISYSSPQTYTQGTAITPLGPANSGGAVGTVGYQTTSSVQQNGGFSQANGIAVDAAGAMYVSDYLAGNITKIANGSFTTWGSGFSSPAGIVFDVAGNLYVADAGNNAIKEVKAGNTGTVTIATGFNAPTGVAIDAAGNIYVADAGNNAVKKIPAGGGTPLTLGSGFSNPTGVAVDAAGNVYVADNGNNLVKEIPAVGNVILSLGIGFNSPYAVTVDKYGNLYVADTHNNAIKMMPSGGSFITIGSGFDQPRGVAVDTKGNVYDADAENRVGSGGVRSVAPAGGYFITSALPAGLSFDQTTGVISGTPTVVSAATNYTIVGYNSLGGSTATLNLAVAPNSPVISYSSPQVYPINVAVATLTPASSNVAAWSYNNTPFSLGSTTEPLDAAADAAGNVYVADIAAGHVIEIPAAGGSPVFWGSFSAPLGVAVDASGNVYVANASSTSIIEVSGGSRTITLLGSGFSAPSAVAVDAAGNVYVADSGNGALKEIPAGNGAPFTIKSGFGSIQGVAVDASGNLFVADEGTSGNGAVYKIPAGGGSMVSVGLGFSKPSGVVVDAAGNLYVSDLSKSVITVIEPDNTQFTLGSGFNSPNGVTVDGSGNVYVADSANGAVKEVNITGGYFLSKLLPAGLTFNNSTGAISGTPTVPSAATNYTVTAYNASGNSTATVNITTNSPPVPAISYSTPQTFVVGSAITPLTPVSTGSAVASLGFNGSSSIVSTGVNDATAVAVDKSGNMYIGESSGRVSVLASGGSAATVFATGFTSSPILSIAVDQSGIVYLADGQVIWKIPATGVRTPVVIERFYNPTSVAVDAAGNVYVADSNEAEELDSNGGEIRNIAEADMLLITVDQNGNVFFYDSNNNVFGSPAGGSNNLLGNTSVAAITTDASGNFYTVTTDGRLVIAPLNGAAAITQGSFPVMKGVAIDASFNLYGALNGNIIKISATGGYFTSPELPSGLTIDGTSGVISGTPSGTSPSADYQVKAFNASGSGTATVNITVNPMAPAVSYSSPQSYQVGTAISALSPASSRVASWGYSASATSIGSGIIEPLDVAADAAGNVYVADVATGNIVKIPAGNGTPVTLAAFSTPSGIAVDAAGNVYVAAVSSGVILEIPAGGGAVNPIGSGFVAPSAVAVDGSGNVYVADSGNGALKEIPAGNPVGTGPVTLQSGFASIQGVAVDASGNIYVADGGVGTSGNGAVYKVPAGGGSMVPVGTGFSRPGGVAVDAAGNLYVSDINKSVITVVEPGGTQFTIGSGFNQPNGLAIDGSGNVYIADSANGKVKEVKINGGYFLSPLLPAGLTFNNSTGAISGTPTIAAAAANYTVTAYNVTTSAQATINITVGVPVISYNGPVAYATGVAIAPLAPSVSGGTIAAPAFNATATTLATGLSDATCLTVGPDGSIYVGESSGQVSKLTAGGSTTTVLATGFSSVGLTEGIAADASGNVYFADGVALWKIPAGGGTANTLGSFIGATGVSLDASGNIYVAAASASPNGGVYRIAPDGTGKTTIINGAQTAVTVDHNGNVFSANGVSNVSEVPAGGVLTNFHSFSQNIKGIACDPSGNVYALTRDSRITMLPANGSTAIQVLAGSGTTAGLAIDANFNVYTVDSGNILKVNADGGYFTNPELPNGLAVDPNTGIISGTPAAASAAANYTVNAFNAFGNAMATLNITVGAPPVISYSTPQTYTRDIAITPLLPSSTGAPISGPAFSTSITLSTGITDANCMAMDKNGNIYIGESSGKVSKLAPGAGTATVYATGFAGVASYTSEGIAVDASGNVYFADLNSVWKIPAGGGTPFTLGSFGAPDGVAVDAAGNVYVADENGSGGVFKMAGDGSGQTKIGNPGVATGIAADANGNVFIVDGVFDELYEIPAGGTLKRLSGFGQPSCVAADVAGNVYIGQPSGFGLQFISAGGRSPSGIGPNVTGQVTGIMVDPNFNLYVANDGIIRKISAAGGYFISPELPNGLTINPNSGAISGMPTAVSPATNYTVTAFSGSVSGTAPVNITVHPQAPTISYTTPQVYVQNTAITPLSPVSTNVGAPGYLGTSTTAGTFPFPFGTAVDQSGNVYVADKGATGIQELLAGGGQVAVGTGLQTPVAVAVDKAGNVYSVNQGDNSVVQIQAHTGIQTFVGSGYQRPSAVAVDSAGNVFVADQQGAAGVVYKIKPGHAKQLFKGGFASPNGIAIDASGNVYVSDGGGGAASLVYKIAADGSTETQLSTSFNDADGVATDASGNLFVSDGGNANIIEYPAGGGSPVTITAGLTFPVGLSADGAGNLYVTDPSVNKVKKLTPAGGYFINRVLPAGLGFNAATGAISGTPTLGSPATNYTVTAYDIIGRSGTATVNIKVTSTDATLASLSLSKGTLSPTFSPGGISYAASVPYSASSVTVTAIPTDAGATVVTKVNGTTASGAAPLNPGANTISVKVTAADGITTKTYTVTVARVASQNAYLSSISPSVGHLSPTFAQATTSYTISVSNAASSMTVTPVSTDPGATIKVNGSTVTSGTPSNPITLAPGAQTAINIAVTAANGHIITYTITVNRAPDEIATLSAIRLSTGTLTPVFTPVILSYSTRLTNLNNSTVVTPTATDPNATITVNGSPSTSGAPVTINNLVVGNNTVSIIVTAQDGTTKKTYTLTVNRPPSINCFLASMNPSRQPLSPMFAPSTTSYTLEVPNAIATMTMAPVTAEPHATMTINNAPATSGTKFGPIALAPGPSTITVVVTAQDGVSKKTYTITVTRDAPPVADVANTVYQPVSVEKPTTTPTLADDGIVVHQGISPNGDGQNDFLQIDNISQYPENRLSIMNRNGQLVYEAKGYDNTTKTFDGHSNKNGQMQLPGTYFYQLDYTVNGNVRHKTGFIVLKY